MPKKSVFVWRRCPPKAGEAFTQTLLMATFWVSAGLSAEHRQPAGDVQLQVLGLGFWVKVLGLRVRVQGVARSDARPLLRALSQAGSSRVREKYPPVRVSQHHLAVASGLPSWALIKWLVWTSFGFKKNYAERSSNGLCETASDKKSEKTKNKRKKLEKKKNQKKRKRKQKKKKKKTKEKEKRKKEKWGKKKGS